MKEPNNSIYSAASLALQVIFQFHRCGTYSLLSRSPSISSLRLMQSADIFRRHLKTFLFQQAFYHDIVRRPPVVFLHLCRLNLDFLPARRSKRHLCYGNVAGWLQGGCVFVHAGIVGLLKRLNIYENFFDHLKAPSF